MVPILKNTVYNEFVHDQVLTSDNLNNLFSYLDEQGRITRSGLIGTGIACGFQIKTTTTGGNSTVFITKGVGITTEGYLVAMPDVTYKKRSVNQFNAVQCEYYQPFVNIVAGSNTQKLDLWELKEEDDLKETTWLTEEFLAGANADENKIVLFFVELLEENNKNCEPNSCDDKGTKVTVSIRPLLAKEKQVKDLLSNASNNATGRAVLLPEIKMPKYNAAALPAMVTAGDILGKYRTVLGNAFRDDLKTKLLSAYDLLKPVLQNDFSDHGLGNFPDFLSYVSSGDITNARFLRLQYFYDFFTSFILAYNELKNTAAENLCQCVADENLFPRHLLVGEALKFSEITSALRTRFSPAAGVRCCAGGEEKIRFLWQRLVLMVQRLVISSGDDVITITPSVLGAQPLSQRAIPYYFNVNVAPKKLYETWNYEKSTKGLAKEILSYKSGDYTGDIYVRNPLAYDIEPYNFFRIEGIVGKNAGTALDEVKKQITEAGLPIKVLALATGTPRLGYNDDGCCSFTDIQLQYKLLSATLLCCIKGHVKYWGSIEKKDNGTGGFVLVQPSYNYTNIIRNMRARFAGPLGFVPGETASTTATGIVKTVGMDTAGAARPATESRPARTAGILPTVTSSGIALSPTIPLRGTTATYMTNSTVYNFYNDSDAATIGSNYLNFNDIRGNLYTFPAPTTSSPADNISHYILLLLDELDLLGDVVSVETIEDFDETAFNTHVERLKEAHNKLTQFVAGFHSKGYLVAKMKLMVQGQAAYIDRLAAAMNIMNDNDASQLMLILVNQLQPGEPVFISQIEAKKGDYAAQRAIIQREFNKINRDDHRELINQEPAEGANTIEYNSMLEQLKKGICFCEIDNLKFLLQQYKAQVNKQQDFENFSVYLKHHPGMQPKAGVTNGGTFIILYKGTNDPSVSHITPNTVIGDFYLPYTCCSDCTPLEITIQQPPPPPNILPTARPGDNVSIQLPVNAVELDGSLSDDPDGEIRKYLWEKLDGNGGTIETPEGNKTLIKDLTLGTYTYQLTVTDDDGGQDSSPITITVLEAANQAPTAIAKITDNKISITLPDNTVELDGSESTDPEEKPLTYEWTFGTGSATTASPIPSAQAKQAVTFVAAGTYSFLLTVKDDKGAPSTATVTVDVLPAPNEGPTAVASATRTSITLPDNTVALDGSRSSDPEGLELRYEWTFVAGPAQVIPVPANAPLGVVNFPVAGVYTFRLTVTDSEGDTDSATVTVEVNPRVTQPPVAVANADNLNPVVINEAALVTLSARGSADTNTGGRIQKYEWAMESGPATVDIINADKEEAQVNLLEPGKYVFKVLVTDNDDDTATASVSVNVSRQELPQENVCGSLTIILNGLLSFDRAPESDIIENSGEYKAQYREIKRFYQVMLRNRLPEQPFIPNQENYFASHEINIKLPGWIKDLQPLLENFEPRFAAVKMLETHMRLAYYLSCIQDKDIGDVNLPMVESMSMLVSMIKVIARHINNSNTETRVAVNNLLDITKEALFILENNRMDKQNYKERLELIRSMITQMNIS